MSWQPLSTAGRACAGSEIAFAIRGGKSMRLSFSIRPDIVRKMKLQDQESLRLESDGKKLCRLVRAGGKESKRVRLQESGRATWECSCTGAVADAWTQNVCEMTPLEMIEFNGEHIVFVLPEWEVPDA